MKVVISETKFQKMLDAIKNGVSKSGNRPFLSYIRLKIQQGNITAMVCDGYSGARFTIYENNGDGEDFVCLIKPISFKASKCGNSYVSIELLDGEAVLSVPTEFGNLTYRFRQNIEWDEKLDGIFDKMTHHDREIGVTAAYMARIMNNFARVSNSRNNATVIESKDSKLEGFRMYAIDREFEFEQFLLPVRM